MVTEQEFSQHLRLAITRAHLGCLVYRQQAGRVRTDRGTWMELAPVGASDLTGIVSPEGWGLQLEIKGARTRETPEQAHWRTRCHALGAVALVIRYDAAADLAANVSRGVDELRMAIEARRNR